MLLLARSLASCHRWRLLDGLVWLQSEPAASSLVQSEVNASSTSAWVHSRGFLTADGGTSSTPGRHLSPQRSWQHRSVPSHETDHPTTCQWQQAPHASTIWLRQEHEQRSGTHLTGTPSNTLQAATLQALCAANLQKGWHRIRHASLAGSHPPHLPLLTPGVFCTVQAASYSTLPQGGSPIAATPPQSGLLAHLPPSLVPYAQLMRLDKPIGTWLLLWPCLWSITLAAPPGQLPDLWMMTLFSVGAVLLRGAGCTVNDLWDKDLDAQVERTRSRPLASGALTSTQAVGLLAAQLSLGLCILLQLNTYSQVLGASSLLLVATYPLMKRFTYWPQAFLGLTINWGAIMGWAAVQGSCAWSVVLPLYLSGVCWSLVYDTIYAHQDKRDDVVAGVKSTALLFGDRTKPILAGFAAAQVALLVLAGFEAGLGSAYYAGVAGMGLHLAQQLARVDLHNGPQCAATFASNKWAGAILFAGCLAERVLL